MGLKLSGQLKATAVVFATATGLIYAQSATAEEITLRSANGLLNLAGELVDFADNKYTIRTPTGEINVSAKHVRCKGSVCPRFHTASAEAAIATPEAIAGSSRMAITMAQVDASF